MGRYKEILDRADLRQIRDYMQFGVESVLPDPFSYQEWLERADQTLMQILEKSFPEATNLETRSDALFDHIETYGDVYLDIGLRAGFRLAVQLLTEADT